jgi:hypothetical protein
MLLDIGERQDSPFRNLLDWPLNQSGVKCVKLTAVEGGMRYVRQVLPDFDKDDDEDTIKEVFLAIWRAAKDAYPSQWNIEAEDDSSKKLLRKVALMALTEFAADRLEGATLDATVDVYNPAEVERYVGRVLEAIPEKFWTSEWRTPLHDSAVYRKTIKDDLRRISKNVRSRRDQEWHEGLKLLGEVTE